MNKLVLISILSAVCFAQTPATHQQEPETKKVAEKVDPKDATIAQQVAYIKWLENKITALDQKVQGCFQLFSSESAMHQLDVAKPATAK